MALRFRTGYAYFARYWVQTIRSLCRAKLADAGRSVLLSTDRREYAEGEPVRLRARFTDERSAPAEDNGVTSLWSATTNGAIAIIGPLPAAAFSRAC